MKIRLYLDEDSMRHALVHALRTRGVDVQTALEAGLIETPDETHLEFATGQGRVLVSFNIGDFFALHSNWTSRSQDHAGMILSRQQQFSVGDQLECLLKLIAAKSAEEIINQIEFLSAWGS